MIKAKSDTHLVCKTANPLLGLGFTIIGLDDDKDILNPQLDVLRLLRPLGRIEDNSDATVVSFLQRFSQPLTPPGNTRIQPGRPPINIALVCEFLAHTH